VAVVGTAIAWFDLLAASRPAAPQVREPIVSEETDRAPRRAA
jgi:hypothetical protein